MEKGEQIVDHIPWETSRKFGISGDTEGEWLVKSLEEESEETLLRMYHFIAKQLLIVWSFASALCGDILMIPTLLAFLSLTADLANSGWVNATLER